MNKGKKHNNSWLLECLLDGLVGIDEVPVVGDAEAEAGGDGDLAINW